MAPGFGKPISSTPSNRVKSAKGGMGSLMGHVVPQQSQMFTSFGVPSRGINQLSQRKPTSKKRYGAVSNSQTFGKKKLRGSAQQNSAPKLNSQNRNKKNQLMQMQQYQQQFQSMPQQDMMANQAQPQGQVGQKLVEMPILSEEFLNQLNEEQLQSLLEQQ